MSFSNQAFRSTISLSIGRLEPHIHFGVQSRCLFLFDIQSRVFSLTFRPSSLVFSVINLFQFGVQSHVFSSTFRVIMSYLSQVFRSTISLSIWCLEMHLQFGVQSHCLFQFDIQSCVFSLTLRAWSLIFSVISFFSSTFKAMSSVQHLESSCLSSVRHLDPPYLFQFNVQSRIFILAFRAIVQFGVQSRIFSLAFKAVVYFVSLVWRSELLFVLV